MSTIKVDTIATRTGSGNITLSNSLASATVAGDLTVDTNTLKVNASTNRVGIGTVSPPQKFVVSNAGADNIVMAENSSASIQMFMQAQSGVGAVGTLTNHDTVFLSNNSEKGRFLAGGGLTFNGDTAAANALDDYEEGTWTPSTSTTSYTITSSTGRYTKIGRIVVLHFNVRFSAVNSSSNSVVTISGVPITPTSVIDFTGSIRENNNTGAIYVTRLGASQTQFNMNSMDSVANGSQRTIRINENYAGTIVYMT